MIYGNWRTIMKTTICLACGRNPSTTITEDGWTPMCPACGDLIGTPIEVGGRAVCHIGSYCGTVLRFNDSTWDESDMAELAHDDGTTAWHPLAELCPAD
jgi:hypothetical protein